MKKLLLLLLLGACDREPKRFEPNYVIGNIQLRCWQKTGTNACFCCNAWLDGCQPSAATSVGFTDCKYPEAFGIQLRQVP